jgi:hypothetical protein
MEKATVQAMSGDLLLGKPIVFVKVFDYLIQRSIFLNIHAMGLIADMPPAMDHGVCWRLMRRGEDREMITLDDLAHPTFARNGPTGHCTKWWSVRWTSAILRHSTRVQFYTQCHTVSSEITTS